MSVRISDAHFNDTSMWPTVWWGQDGLTVYEEIHQNWENCLIHGLFLGFVFFGVFCSFGKWIGDYLFDMELNILDEVVSIWSKVDERCVSHKCVLYNYDWLGIQLIMLLYSGYYFYIEPQYGVLSYVMVYPWAHLADMYMDYNKVSSVKVGLTVMTVALVIQEVVGHSYLEAENSRLTASFILNAIMYSPLFYATFWFNNIVDYINN